MSSSAIFRVAFPRRLLLSLLLLLRKKASGGLFELAHLVRTPMTFSVA